MGRDERGFSILELTIAVGIMLTITGTMFTLLSPSQGTFAAQPEVSDLQQRLRVVQATISRDLVAAGAGPYTGPQTTGGGLNYYFPPVLPYRQGSIGDDAPGTFFTDRITLFYVPTTTAGTTLSAQFPAGANMLSIVPETNCPTSTLLSPVNVCGFSAPGSILVVDGATGSFDTFAIAVVDNFNKTISVSTLADTAYAASSKVVPVVDRTYYLKTDDPTNYQLVYYDGSLNADVPVVDHVVSLAFDYWGDRQPPQFRVPNDPTGGTTYGPAPDPTRGMVGNCVFADNNGTPVLPVLGDGSNPDTLIKLTAAQFTDGPWCPDGATPNRWDADLLRVRKIGVRVRVESASDAMRGPATVLGADGKPVFMRAGTSIGAPRWVPDQEIYFQVSPRNLNLGR